MPYVVTDACIQCGACAAGCESNAITEGETQSHIDVNLCIECGTCERNCPSEAIIYVDEDQPEVQSAAVQKENTAPSV
jgi:ferredoxin